MNSIYQLPKSFWPRRPKGSLPWTDTPAFTLGTAVTRKKLVGHKSSSSTIKGASLRATFSLALEFPEAQDLF